MEYMMEKIELSNDEYDLLFDAFRAINIDGWGVPTAYEDEGWTTERYEEAYFSLIRKIENLLGAVIL